MKTYPNKIQRALWRLCPRAKNIPAYGFIYIRQCPLADQDHARAWRNFMHTGHHPSTICYAKASLKLPYRNLYGLCAHELAHLFSGSASQKTADTVARKVFGRKIRYDKNRVEYMELD